MNINEAIQNKSVPEYVKERFDHSRATVEKLGSESGKLFKKAQEQMDAIFERDAQKTIEELKEQSLKIIGQVEEKINEGIEVGLKKLSIPSVKEFEALKLMVSKLEGEIKKMKKQMPKPAPKTTTAKKTNKR